MNDLDEVADARALGHLGRGEQDGGRVGVVLEGIDREKCARLRDPADREAHAMAEDRVDHARTLARTRLTAAHAQNVWPVKSRAEGVPGSTAAR